MQWSKKAATVLAGAAFLFGLQIVAQQAAEALHTATEIFWGLGMVSALEGDNAQAAEQLERVVDLLPEWPGGCSTLGVFYFQSGQIEKAREVLNRFKNSNASASLDINRIEQVLDQANAASVKPEPSLSNASRSQLLQLALSLADRTL